MKFMKQIVHCGCSRNLMNLINLNFPPGKIDLPLLK